MRKFPNSTVQSNDMIRCIEGKINYDNISLYGQVHSLLFFLLHPKNCYNLSLRVTFSDTFDNLYKS